MLRPAGPRPTPAQASVAQHLSWRLALFVVLLALWSWRLCSPISPELRDGILATGQPYLAAKTAHVVGYAALAALAVGLLAPRLLIGFLVLHGVATEVIQTYVPGRTGQFTDVLIDWAGIAVGVLAARFGTRRRG
ncbi:VanZ family protein [Urbifossiella limnaea]|uniref:VanZ like family protein n=1 Tax=Urbifossiella limnaea TaxID=2528023 RepID=A0A517XM34_9BACT|nr:VanZ family protein [Urbifossiella limnaea]QDU18536.1 VanZ like family protein [Urbifossiella limnaea]